MNTKKHTIAAACALMLSGAAMAQEGPQGPGDGQPRAGAKLERVEISARPQSDTDLRRKSQVAKQIYGREELDKFGDTNVADVLKRLPGVNVAGGAPRMRGLGSGYTLILLNGDPAPPGFDLTQLDPAQVERIEVTKGPSADQSAQAVAGAINIILKDAPKITQRDLRLNMGYNAVRPSLAGSYTYGEKKGDVAYTVPFSLFSWRGLNESVNTRAAPGTDGMPSVISQKQEQNFWGAGWNSTPRLNWKISDEQNLTAMAFLQQGRWHFNPEYETLIKAGLPSEDYNSRNIGTWQMVRGNLQYNNQFSETQRIELKAGVQEARGSFKNYVYDKLQRGSVGDNSDRNFTQAGKYAQVLNDSHSLAAGWDLEWRKREETRFVTVGGQAQLPGVDGLPFAATIQRQAFFVQDEWEISPQWSAYLGLRTERIVTESAAEGDAQRRNSSSVTTPLLHVNYKIDPKGRDLIRTSLTRSYKAPNLNQLLARPAISGLYPDPNTPNTYLAPDFIGNPGLKPELATGLDVAYEKYLSGGGMISIGGFYRRVNDLMRNVTTLEAAGSALNVSKTQARYVNHPTNFARAETAGLEFEIKGRAGELIPSVFDTKLPLNLRASFNYYKSKVQGLPGPDNRLDGQQPWSVNAGFDYRLTGLPVNMGANFNFTPGYVTTQTLTQSMEQTRNRGIDMFAQWTLSRTSSIRFSANNLWAVDTRQTTFVTSGYSRGERSGRTQFGLSWDQKL
ncbi:TonB-dependent receptor [Pelomonas sp. SE-A7]|uniref:TonB-dependent receptor plug domain-containing protein n=1 Tax=Pelomonas sp. SE-A7 TaxID=3054953 RepID=UPI00259D1860|nr:TonB-dependent receptor [Pelomonas sp. SE-A7]MDM4767457.1 TonB-dependent receptor [Pelomonas sp. SE-A7]